MQKIAETVKNSCAGIIRMVWKPKGNFTLSEKGYQSLKKNLHALPLMFLATALCRLLIY